MLTETTISTKVPCETSFTCPDEMFNFCINILEALAIPVCYFYCCLYSHLQAATKEQKNLDNYLVIWLYPYSLHEFCYSGLCSFSHTCSFRKRHSSEKSFSSLLVSGLSFQFCSSWFWVPLLLVKIPWCDTPWSLPRSVSQVLGSLLSWAAPQTQIFVPQ